MATLREAPLAVRKTHTKHDTINRLVFSDSMRMRLKNTRKGHSGSTEICEDISASPGQIKFAAAAVGYEKSFNALSFMKII